MKKISKQGYAARINGLNFSDNPYQRGSEEFFAWQDGHQEACDSIGCRRSL
jgi:hypothetical protein